MGRQEVLNPVAHARTGLAWAMALLMGLGMCPTVGASGPKKTKTKTQAAPKVPQAGLHLPERLTAGSSNQMMGSLSPDGQTLYLVSDQNSTAEIFIQQPVLSGPRLLFETNADVAQPRPSPDGRSLAFLSYQTDAAGDACIFDLATRESRCLTGADTAEAQIFWLDGGEHLGVVSRAGLHADLELVRHAVRADAPKSQVLLKHNLSGPTLSPDGRWLAYVPLVRVDRQVGVSFSNRSAMALGLVRLDRPEKKLEFQPDLPGTTGFPAFSQDGTSLFFSQYLNDTNGDGTIDGNDNSVLFRVGFDPARDDPIRGFPEQLSSARWNCRYPTPSANSLVMTCSHDGSLDVYSLPLSGAVPAGWSLARVRAELVVARDHWTQLLLLGRLLTGLKAAPERLQVLRRMAVLHLELREYESALFYCEQIQRLAGKAQAAGLWAQVLAVLSAHRRADVALSQGKLSEEYIAAEDARAQSLAALDLQAHGDVAALRALTLSEIHTDVGRKAEALASLQAVSLADLKDPLVVRLYAHRAREVYHLRADRQALLTLLKSLSAQPSLPEVERLHFAEELVGELVRGLPADKRLMQVQASLAETEAESEAGLMLRVYTWLHQLGELDQDQVRAGLFKIYKANKKAQRRRALVLATVRMASRLGNEYLQYQFATSWASWLKRSDPERKYAEALYRRVVLDRAYQELAKDRISEARGYFYATTVQTDSLEAYAGFIEAYIAEGKGKLDEVIERRFKSKPDHPAAAFVAAYRMARELPAGPTGRAEDDQATLTSIDGALDLLEQAARTWPRRFELHHLQGHLLHRRHRFTSTPTDAVSAYRHYLLALDLARKAPRSRAALDLSAGLLQAHLGNHRLALMHLQRRQRLPHVRPLAELSWRLALARSLFHTSLGAQGAEQALAQAKQALSLIDAKKALAKHRPLVLDRLALYSLAAGQPEQSLEYYGALLAAQTKSKDLATPVNRLKAHLGLATAAMTGKKNEVALEHIRLAQQVLAEPNPLRPEQEKASADLRDSKRFSREDYLLLLSGLRAQALGAAGKLPAAAEALATRRALQAQRFKQADVDDELLELARTDHHLAEVAHRQGKRSEVLGHLERGLNMSEQFNKRTGSQVNPVGLRLLQALAEWHLSGPAGPPPPSLYKRLERTYSFICENRSPRWAAERHLFGLYLTQFDLSPVAAGGQ